MSGKYGLLPVTREDTMADAIDDLFRRFGKAFNKADAEEIAACVTDDFEWRLNAGGAPSGRVLTRASPIARRASRRRASIAPATSSSALSASPASTMPASRSIATASTSTR